MRGQIGKLPTSSRLAIEHEIIQRLMDELRQLIAVVPRSGLADWIASVGDRFAHFEAHKIKHMALEEQEGYAAPDLQDRPTLARELARLKNQHGELMRLMRSIREDVQQVQEDDSIMPRDVCARMDRLFGYIEQHEREEDLLLIDAFSTEIGVKD